MPDLSSLVLVGAGGFGREMVAVVEAVNDHTVTWDLVGFADDDADLQGTDVMGHPVRGDVNWLANQGGLHFALTIGDGEDRRRIAGQLGPAEVQPATLVHPSVSVHRTTTVGDGAMLCQGASLTVNVSVGAHAILDQGCTVGHDAVLDSFVSLRPGTHVSGAVHLERGVTMGAGSVVLPEVTVGANATVGAGAVVTEDLPANCTAVGVPARPRS